MRLQGDIRKVLLAFGMSVPLAACGGGSGTYDLVSSDAAPASATNGPEADYPQVLGEAFTVDGQLYTPEDTYSYDAVGYATVDIAAGTGVSLAHKTLPMPSYVEVTSLDTGRTILARVERRGPMTSARLVALSPDAATQLGASEGAPVRVRRVNPPEFERAELRAGKTVEERLATPDSLLAVLKKKLPSAGGSTNLAASAQTPPVGASPPAKADVPRARATGAAASTVSSAPVQESFDRAFARKQQANGAYPLPPLAAAKAPAPQQAAQVAIVPATTANLARQAQMQRFSLPGVQTAAPATTPVRAGPAAEQAAPLAGNSAAFVVQAGAFASKANAERLASKLDGGFVTKAGSYYRVRCGPYRTRGQADAALAKVRAAGYSDARVVSAG